MASPVAKYALHKAVILNDTEEVINLVKTREVDIDERDAGGIPPIHYAIHMGNKPMLDMLLELGADPTRKSAAGWNTVQEAIAASNRPMVKSLLTSIQKKITTEYEKRLPVLVDAVKKIPDFYMELKWEFFSWVPLVSRLCPHDTYKIYKRGACFRVDTTLVGFENMKWIRGDISFIFRGDEGGHVFVVDHVKKTVENALTTNPKNGTYDDTEITDKDVRRMMAPEINRTTALTDKVEFSPAKTWIGYEKTEKIGTDAWKAKVYEFQGFDLKIMNRKKVKRKDVQVLAAAEERQILLDRVDTVADKQPQGLLFPYEDYTEKIKTYKGTAWLSEEFPRTVEELLPIFETLAPTQKHFNKMNQFISMKMPTCGFPVKLDIPCFPTVTGSVTFLTHQEMEIEQDKFEIPDGYKTVTRNDPNTTTNKTNKQTTTTTTTEDNNSKQKEEKEKERKRESSREEEEEEGEDEEEEYQDAGDINLGLREEEEEEHKTE